MAGLLDFLMQGQNQPGGGLLGGFGNVLGNNQDTLLALGLGLAGGNTVSEGFRGGMQGLLQGRKSDRERVAGQDFMKELSGVAGTPPAMMPQAMPQMAPAGIPAPQPSGPFGGAIAGIESGGRYDALGPVTKDGDQAFGKYQVMGKNVGPWTAEVLGAPMTPQQFVANPQAQDAVFKAKFGQYAQKYGPDGAARAWFAGEGGMNDPNRKDQLGTSVASYARKFNAGMGQPQVSGFDGAAKPDAQGVYPADAVMAQADPAALPPNATLTQGYAIPGQPAAPVPNDQLGAIRNMPIGTVLKWAMNPHLAGPQREVAKEIFKARLEDTKMTEAQKDFMRARVDGFTGSFADWKNNPSFGDTGQRDEFDRPIQGWRNPNTGAVLAPRAGVPGAAETKAPIELVTKLRKEVQDLPSYKNITAAAPVYDSMRDAASRDDRAADVNMIYGLAKIMDPTSVVRESEMTIAQAVATLPQQLRATVESQLTGTGRLSADVREAIMREAHSRVTAYKGRFDIDAQQYGGIVQRYRMNPDDVLPKFGAFEPFKPKKAEGGPSVFSNPYEAEMRRRGLLK